MSLQKPLGERCGVVRKMIDEFAIKVSMVTFLALMTPRTLPGRGLIVFLFLCNGEEIFLLCCCIMLPKNLLSAGHSFVRAKILREI